MTKKGFTVIEGVVIVALVLVVIGILSMSKKKTDSVMTTPTVIDTATSNSTATADWKTYTSTKYGYSIKYPTTWKLNDSKPEMVTLNSPTNEAVLAKVNSGAMYGEGYMEDIIISFSDSVASYTKVQGFEATTLAELAVKDQTLMDVKDTTLGNEPAKEATAGGFGAYYVVLSNHNKHYYQILFGTNAEKNTLTTEMKAILVSFAFTK